jgi:hypothetical protein
VKKTSNPCKTACWQVKRKRKTTCKCKLPFGCWRFCSPLVGMIFDMMNPNHTQGPISVELFGDFLGPLFCWWSLWQISTNSIPTYFQITLC